ncbi:MAG: hypothetical protein S4CHLAM102_11430 [Chlamydiia bacterium]|nr:hypothetical protein [Chlamydiia bacterium]
MRGEVSGGEAIWGFKVDKYAGATVEFFDIGFNAADLRGDKVAFADEFFFGKGCGCEDMSVE